MVTCQSTREAPDSKSLVELSVSYSVVVGCRDIVATLNVHLSLAGLGFALIQAADLALIASDSLQMSSLMPCMTPPCSVDVVIMYCSAGKGLL